MMYFCDLENREVKELVPGIIAKTFWGENMMVVHVELEANAVVPNHSHPHEQAGVILEGELTLTIDGDSRILKAGEMYIIPGGVEHRAKAHAGKVKAMDIFSPVREEYQY